MKIPKRPTFGELLATPAERLDQARDLELVHDLMDIVLDGSKYINECTALERTPQKIDLDRFLIASQELKALTDKYNWDLPTKIIDSLNG